MKAETGSKNIRKVTPDGYFTRIYIMHCPENGLKLLPGPVLSRTQFFSRSKTLSGAVIFPAQNFVRLSPLQKRRRR
jgi:hypothetical protein